jgi:hypothetical protein
MCEKNENPKNDTSDDKTTPALAAGVGAGLGLAIGTLAACPPVGLVLVLIWGAQAALCAATGYQVESSDIS